VTESRRKRTKSPDFISRNKKRFHGAKIFIWEEEKRRRPDFDSKSKKNVVCGGAGGVRMVANNIGEILA